MRKAGPLFWAGLVVLGAAVGCGGSPAEAPPTDGGPDGCPEDAVRHVPCGLNEAGLQAQVCIDGAWEDQGTCDDPGECAHEEERMVSCVEVGPRTLQPQVCADGVWEDAGECVCEDEGTVYDPFDDACVPSPPCFDEDWFPYGGGVGTASDPFRICTNDHLRNVSRVLNAHFVLARSLNLSGEDLEPLGTSQEPFTGVFDGADRVMAGLTLDGAGQNERGLFGRIQNAEIRDVRLVDFEVSGDAGVGALVGRAIDSLLERAQVIGGQVTGGGAQVGGLVGSSNGEISQCSASAQVTGEGFYVGGLVGHNEGEISQCSASAQVTGESGRVGGLVGGNLVGTITQCWASGPVTGNGDAVGGLVGVSLNGGAITQSWASGAVIGEKEEVGGLVGSNHGAVTQCWASGPVAGQDEGVGGLAGVNDLGGISESYAFGLVEWDDGEENEPPDSVGALVGRQATAGTIACFAREEGGFALLGQDSGSTSDSGLLREEDFAEATPFEGVGWDFDDAWTLSHEAGRPILQWTIDE